jgi:RND family efflux transporter MFP subunit
MNTNVDIRELAVERGRSKQSVRSRRHILTRYALPAVLILGFLLLIAWASWDMMFPPRLVTVVPVLTSQAEVRQAGTPLFNAAGWIEPRPTAVRVAALAPGVIEQLLVVEDQPVKLGDPVAELIKDDARLSHERTLADLKLREAELEEAKAALVAAKTRLEQPVHLEAALGQADAALAKLETQLKNLPFEARRAEADLEFATKDYEGNVTAKGAVSGRVVDSSKRVLESARALVEELQDRAKSLEKEQAALTGRRDSLETQLELLADETRDKDEAEARVKAADARLEQTRVVVAEAKLRLDRMTVRAPIDGRVYRLVADPGAKIGSGGMTQMIGHDSSTVVTLYRPQRLQVRVDVRFEDIPKVSPGQPVEIENPALTTALVGKVLFVSSEADIQKNTSEVKVEIPSPPPVFKPAMLVDVTFLSPERLESSDEKQTIETEDRIYVPRPYIHQDSDGSYVWLADRSMGVARRTSIEVEASSAGELIEVTSGLTIASRLIASGIEELRDGDRIRVIGEAETLERRTGL